MESLPEVFKAIPGFSRYVVSQTGVVLEVETGQPVPVLLDNDDYRMFGLIRDNGTKCLVGRYRLMALAYLPIPETDERLVVNHINGIKYDDRLENLEWTTYQENTWHAGLHGLTTKCIPTVVFDIDSRTETLYPSALEAAKALGLSKDAVLWRLGTDGQRAFPERKLYRRHRSKTPWVNIDPNEKIVWGRCREVVVNYIRSGEIKTYDSAREASRALGCSEAAMSNWLTKVEGCPVLPGLVQVKFASDTFDFPEVDDPWVELMRYTKERCVFAYHEKENRVEIYEHGAACSKMHGISPTNLHYKLNSGRKTAFPNGYRYGYYPENLGSVLPVTVK